MSADLRDSLTKCSLCISVVTLVVWIARLSLQRGSLDVYGSLITNALYDVLLAALWTYSTTAQNSPDVSDPEHISLRPWHLERGCRDGGPRSRRACGVLSAAYGLSVVAV